MKTKILSSLFLCALTATSFANSTTLKVTTLTDYANDRGTLSKAKTFSVDSNFAGKYLDFYMFRNGEDKVCFTGSAEEAADIIDVILNVSTGDAFVYPGKVTLSKNSIKQNVRFEDEGGDHTFKINVSRCK